MTERRAFNNKERIAAYLASGGKCEQCGAELRLGYHADHITPYSKGGATDLTNIAALCPTCNLSKGAKMSRNLPEWSLPLRKWQLKAWSQYQQKESQSFLTVATPGAGKTLFALRVAYESLATGDVDRVAIIAPTVHLCRQWSQAASRVGINISIYDNLKMNEPRDSHGIVATYQSMAYNPDLYRLESVRRRTLAIIDEIHHAGESDHLSWGPALRHAFGPAASILALSGTPFRTDNSAIPFIRYENNISQADYNYSYARALEDGICRTVYFPTFEGDINWLEDGEYVSASFADLLSEDMMRKRLNVAVQTPDYLRGIFAQAHENLMRLRRTEQPDAGGLLIASDIANAKEACRVVEEVAGVRPFLATSDESDGDGSLQIKRFTNSDAPWIVAVKMISEGVDIPRLRVLVYNTNYTSPLFFIQAIGRVVRVMPDVNNSKAFVYMPKDPRLEDLARSIIQEREHVLQDRELNEMAGRETAERDWNAPVIIPHTGNAIPSDTIYMGEQYGKEMLPAAERYGKQHNFPTPALQVILTEYERDRRLQNITVTVNTSPPIVDDRPYQEKLDGLKKSLREKAKQLVMMMQGGQYHQERFGKEMKRIYSRLYALGHPNVNQAGNDDLRNMQKQVEQWILEWSGGAQ